MTMIAALGILVFLAVLGGLVFLGVRLWRGREEHGDQEGIDLIPYLIMALAVGVAGFSLSRLARASLAPDQLTGRPTGQIAGALAGLVVAAPIGYLLWRRQSKRRAARPGGPGWPIYLALVEVVFLTAFFVAVAQIASAVTTNSVTAQWPDLVVFGAIVGFHWWAERREPPGDVTDELPRLTGSGVALIALTVGAVGTLNWLFSEGYEALGGTITIPDPAVPLGLLVTALPIWVWRWLPGWPHEPTPFRSFYLASVTVLALSLAVGAAVALVGALLAFVLGEGQPAGEHFTVYPPALAVGIVGGALWLHHRRRIGDQRTGALRGYEYGMAAAGLGVLIATAVALVMTLLEPSFAGRPGEMLIVLACSVIASGAVWLWFWRKTQAAPRQAEVTSLQRRFYLIGMTIITGLTATGALIAALVVVFRAVLGEQTAILDSLELPVTLTVVSGAAFWHLFSQIRADGAARRRIEIKPFTVTVVCSHPGNLMSLFPREATTRVLYRADSAGVIDEEMAGQIVAAVGNVSSLVWVDGDGFRVAAAGPA